MDYIKITPNPKKAGSIIRMVDSTLEMIGEISVERFPSNVVREYYEVIRELMTVVMLLDGFKCYGEGSHSKLISYMKKEGYLSQAETSLVDELRRVRNRISYDGFFVDSSFVKDRLSRISSMIKKLKRLTSS